MVQGPHWWETPGSLRTELLRLDGEVGAVMNAEKRVVEPAVVSDDVARHLGRLIEQTGLGAGNGPTDHPDSAPVLEPVKRGFTREAGSIRRQVSPHRVREPGE